MVFPKTPIKIGSLNMVVVATCPSGDPDAHHLVCSGSDTLL